MEPRKVASGEFAEGGDLTALAALAAVTPRFGRRSGAPPWLACWEGEDTVVVLAHGDVRWGAERR
ncbi:hypothetical protein [Nocardioides humi]|nr:hypothetical protein [Nocardioides humi]